MHARIHSLRRFFLQLIAVAITVSSALPIATGEDTSWIRPAGGDGYCKTSFSIDQPVVKATLRCAGYATGVDIYWSGELVYELEPFDPLFQLDVTSRCNQGMHTIGTAIRGTSYSRAGFLRLDLVYADGSRQQIGTDHKWMGTTAVSDNWFSSQLPEDSWKPVDVVDAVDQRLLIPLDRGTDVNVVENYDQWKRALSSDEGTSPESFQLVDGFKVQRVRSAKKDEDSWVSIVFDPQGRLIIAKEKKGLLRMTLSDTSDDSQPVTVTDVEVIDDTVLECRGMQFIGRDLYVNANNSKTLYRLASDEQDGFQKPEAIYQSAGGVGHGRNDIAIGPDGSIFSIHGDSVDLPKKNYEDLTSPFRDARRGRPTREGHLLRIDPKSKAVTLLAAGLRNPFGIALNRRGDAFTYDADAEFDMGTPWYRPTRVSHLVVGGDFGWRGVTGKWPPYYHDHPDNAMPNLDIGKGSPTAAAFGYQSHFPPRYREALFILDWTYGRVIAVHTIPCGESYLMTAENFMQGRPLNVTDLAFGPDGAMYLSTGGRGMQSALYRISYHGDSAAYPVGSIDRLVRSGTGPQLDSSQRTVSLAMPHIHMLPSAINRLADEDPRVRHHGRNEVERYEVSQWSQRGLSIDEPRVALQLLMSLARSGEDEFFPEIIDRLNTLPWQKQSRSDREVAAYTYLLCTATESFDQTRTSAILESVHRAFPDRYYSVNRLLSELIVRLKSPRAVELILPMAIAATDQHQQMHFLYVLRHVTSGWTPQTRRKYLQLLTGMTDYISGQGMDQFIATIRDEAVATLSVKEKEQYAEIIASIGRRELDPEFVNHTAPRREIVRTWTVDEALAASGSLQGDAANGRQLFATAQCIHCHQFAGDGRAIGPDLTHVANRFRARDLLDSVVHPAKIIPEKYRSIRVVTIDGTVFSGLPALGGDYRSTKLRLATDPMNPYKITEIVKDDIQTKHPSPTSWMPEGLLNTLSAQEIADLLAFLNVN